jgi:hypothetical protein
MAQCIISASLQVTPSRSYKCLKLICVHILNLWIHVAMSEIAVFMYACRVMYFLLCHLLISLL